MALKFLHPFYFFLIGIGIFVLFAISVYLYILTPYRLEPIVLYYADVSTEDDSHAYLPEIRNMPMSTLMVVPSMYKNDVDLLMRFVHELFLGSKNIYARNLVPVDVVLDDVYVSNDVLYLVLSTALDDVGGTGTTQRTLTQQDAENIVEWVQYNVNKYFDIKKTLIIIDKVSINK